MRSLLVLPLVACSTAAHAPTVPAPAPAQVLVPVEPTIEAPAPAEADSDDSPFEEPYGDEVRSVRFLRATVLYREPGADAAKVGIIRKGARARPRRAVPGGAGCAGEGARWIEIEPRGWACEDALAPSPDEPSAARPASLVDDDEDPADTVVPGVYGMVRGKGAVAYARRADAAAGVGGRVLAGSVSVRAAGVVRVGGRRYWRTSGGDLIDAASIVRFSPSRFAGVAVDSIDRLPLAWAQSRRDPRKPVPLRAEPRARARVTGRLAPRALVDIAEVSADGRFARVGEAGWVARADLHLAYPSEPPPGTLTDEKWFDVDLDEQVLVAYVGDRPVYATLVSTGRRGHGTPPGVYRVAAKLERATMSSDEREVYSVADVPWTMNYDHDYALHAAYWHDGFGGVKSHGCVNLAPTDARLLYGWSSPDVPPGWTAVYGDEDAPGSLVRVRSARVPEPPPRGYARSVQEARARLAAAVR